MTDLNISAISYALLQSGTTCWKCSAATTVTAIWVPGFIDNEDEECPEEGGAALLKYISDLDAGTMARVRAASPWLKPNYSHTADQTYLANHCQACDALQGDHFVYCPDGPLFPQDQAGVDQLKVLFEHGPLMASASTAQSGWMELLKLPAEGRQLRQEHRRDFGQGSQLLRIRAGMLLPIPCFSVSFGRLPRPIFCFGSTTALGWRFILVQRGQTGHSSL